MNDADGTQAKRCAVSSQGRRSSAGESSSASAGGKAGASMP
jgi:hypothetical protein